MRKLFVVLMGLAFLGVGFALTIDLGLQANYTAGYSGGHVGDLLGYTNNSGLGVQLVNADGGVFANDLLVSDINASVLGLSTGAVYLIKDINVDSGLAMLDFDANYSVRFVGCTNDDQIGFTDSSGLGVQLVNVDGNSYSNDLLITASYANTQSLSDNGAIYLIRDIDAISGTKKLCGDTNFNVRWDGGVADDRIGYSGSSGLGVQLVNVDGNITSNDLIVSAMYADSRGLADNGSIFLIKDINLMGGSKWLKWDSNFSVRWDGESAVDYLGYTQGSGQGVQLVNVDGNSASNDLLIASINADTQGLTDNGAVYLIKDIQARSGNKWLKGDLNFTARWDGGSTSDKLGWTVSGLGVQLANIDGNVTSNDLLISAVYADTQGLSDNGALYLLKDINLTNGSKWLKDDVNFSVRWDGTSASDLLGRTNAGTTGFQLVNVDGNAFSNDLLVSADQADTQGLVNNGAVYLLKDIQLMSGNKLLNSDANFSVRWDGASASDYLGYNYISGQGAQLVNVDGNVTGNDLIITARNASTQGLANNGAVYLIKDINLLAKIRWLAYDTNFSVRWDGGANTDYLGDSGGSGLGVQLVNIDGNTISNDLLITADEADTHGLVDNGAIYLVKDIGTKSGNKWLKDDINFSSRWSGASASDKLGYTNKSGLGVQVLNADGNVITNDLLITASYADTAHADSGAIYLINNIGVMSGNKLLNTDANFNTRWDGESASDLLGYNNNSGLGVQIVNVDGNTYSNDLLVVAPYADAWGLENSGAIYLLRDISTAVANENGTTCSCPTSGNWEIGDGSACTLSTACTLNASNLHISNGSLNISSTGTLRVPTGKKVIVDDGQALKIEKGGKIIIDK
jgi:hypothetical protein